MIQQQQWSAYYEYWAKKARETCEVLRVHGFSLSAGGRSGDYPVTAEAIKQAQVGGWGY